VTALVTERVGVTLERARVVDGISLALEPGDWVALIGPNGAGKTTLLRAVAGLVPYEGSIALGGDEVASLGRREQARRTAVVPQIPVIPPDMSVLEYVVLGRTPHLGYAGAPGRRDADAARSALGALDALHLVDRRLGSLSGGERQRAVLARAVAQDAGLLLLDEPTSALDPAGRRTVRGLLEELRRRGTAVLLNSHLLSEIELVCDRVVIIDRGRVVARGTPAELSRAKGVEIETAAGLRTYPEAGREDVPGIVAGLVAEGEAVYGVRVVQTTLEEAYLEAVEDTGP